jgi:hypothetical protein
VKFGPRIPSLRKRIAARTSPARFIRHSLGLKAPRGLGWLTNPKRAAYNRIYNRTSFGCLIPALLALLLVALLASLVFAGQETRLYDASGRYQGRATTNTANPQQKSLYDQHGRYVGRVMTDDKGNARMYNQHGKYMGRTTGSPTPPDKTK